MRRAAVASLQLEVRAPEGADWRAPEIVPRDLVPRGLDPSAWLRAALADFGRVIARPERHFFSVRRSRHTGAGYAEHVAAPNHFDRVIRPNSSENRHGLFVH
jgi:hypothetical protein